MSEPFGSDGSSYSGSDGGSDGGTIGSGSVESAGNSGATTGQAQNGAWTEMLGVVPREFHPVITPHLQKFDSNYGQLAQSYAPWKKAFADKGQSAEDLVAAQQLYDLVNTNPELVYQRLAAHLESLRAAQPGYVPQNYQQNYQQGYSQPQEPQQQDGFASQEAVPEGAFEDPRVQQMYQQMQQMNEYLQQQQMQMQQQQVVAAQQQLTSNYEQMMDSGIRQIMARDPNVDVQDLLQRTLVQTSQGMEPDIERAYAEQSAFVQRVRSMPMNSATAPRVMPTGGGMPPTIDTTRPRSSSEKVDRVRQLLEAAQQ